MTSDSEPRTRHRVTEQGLDAHGVDLREPLLPQVAALGERYEAWVHEPVPPNTAARLRGDRTEKWAGSLRIFTSDFLEKMSHIYWQLILVIWIPIVAALFAGAVYGVGLSPGAAGAWALLGVFLWTLLEYALHRWLFHYKPRSPLGRKLVFLLHGIHHLDPWDKTRLVFPPPAGFVIAAAIFAAVRLALPWGPALATMAGILAGYVVYDMTHYYTHHGKPKTRWGKYLKRYHLAHHHKAWEAMYGVSQPLWDFVFHTTEPKRESPAADAPRAAATDKA